MARDLLEFNRKLQIILHHFKRDSNCGHFLADNFGLAIIAIVFVKLKDMFHRFGNSTPCLCVTLRSSGAFVRQLNTIVCCLAQFGRIC